MEEKKGSLPGCGGAVKASWAGDSQEEGGRLSSHQLLALPRSWPPPSRLWLSRNALDLEQEKTWVCSPALSLTSCVPLGQSLPLSEPRFPHLPHSILVKIEMK